MWPAKLKIFSIWPYTGKGCGPLFYIVFFPSSNRKSCNPDFNNLKYIPLYLFYFGSNHLSLGNSIIVFPLLPLLSSHSRQVNPSVLNVSQITLLLYSLSDFSHCTSWGQEYIKLTFAIDCSLEYSFSKSLYAFFLMSFRFQLLTTAKESLSPNLTADYILFSCQHLPLAESILFKYLLSSLG